jgi:dsRNA-specific ribonuclease
MLQHKDIISLAKDIKIGLNLSYVFEDMDAYLLVLSFLHKSSSKMLSKKVAKTLIERYNAMNYEFLEFLGDAILDIILAQLVIDFNLILNAKKELERNDTLIRISTRLSPYIISISGSQKSYADILESLLGAMFEHLYPKYGYASIGIIADWFIKNTDIISEIERFEKRENDKKIEFFASQSVIKVLCVSLTYSLRDLTSRDLSLSEISFINDKLKNKENISSLYLYLSSGKIKRKEKIYLEFMNEIGDVYFSLFQECGFGALDSIIEFIVFETDFIEYLHSLI